jgi:hypothetical protein
MNPLPQLLDCKQLRAELGVSRAAVEAIMRKLPVVLVEDFRKPYVERSDIPACFNERTFETDQVAAS